MHYKALPEALAAPRVLQCCLRLFRLQHVCGHAARPPLPIPGFLLIWIVYLHGADRFQGMGCAEAAASSSSWSGLRPYAMVFLKV